MLKILGKPWWHSIAHMALGAFICFIIAATAEQQILPALLGVISAAIAKEATDMIDQRDTLVSASEDVIEWVIGALVMGLGLSIHNWIHAI